MGLGNFGQKLVASAKLSSMEKYGWAYMDDYMLVRDNLATEIFVEEMGDGTVRITHNGRTFEVKIRDWTGKKSNGKNGGEIKKVEGERKGWVSVWDVSKH